MTNPIPKKTKSRTRAKRKNAENSVRQPAVIERPGGKLGLILNRLEDKTGATLNELVDATGWQKHSVHGALSRLRTRGFAIGLEAKEGRKAYRLAQVEA